MMHTQSGCGENIMQRQMHGYREWVLIVLVILTVVSGCAPAPGPEARRPLPSDQVPAPVEPDDDDAQLTAEWAYQQGLQALAQENYDTAIQAFHLAVERDPRHARAYLSLGDVHSQREEFLAAESYYNKILEIDPHSLPAMTALASMQWRRGNHRDALALYRKALEIEPHNHFAQQQINALTREMFDMHAAQGREYLLAGDLAQATVAFQKAYSVDPENWAVAVEIGRLFLQQGDSAMADGYFQQVLSAQADFLPAIIGAGQVQLTLQHYDEAIRYFERARLLNPTDPETTALLREAQRAQLEASLPDQYWQIAASAQVTRGEIAALLIVDLLLEQRLHTSDRMVIISDITTHWAKAYILKVVQYEIMSLPPDRFFRPNDPIARGELAFVIDALFRTIGQPLPPGGRLPFADVHPDNAYYDAIARVYAAGIMPAPSESVFGILNTVFGREALDIFERIRMVMR
jgi:tetratricopeptide (TPR) repeat protein